jgi:hypothetical protein
MSVLTDHLRLTILRVLHSSPGLTANSSIIQGVCGEFGVVVSRDVVKTEIAWLEEQGLLKSQPIGQMVVATISERGLDVAEGRAIVPGVQRPAPGA